MAVELQGSDGFRPHESAHVGVSMGGRIVVDLAAAAADHVISLASRAEGAAHGHGGLEEEGECHLDHPCALEEEAEGEAEGCEIGARERELRCDRCDASGDGDEEERVVPALQAGIGALQVEEQEFLAESADRDHVQGLFRQRRQDLGVVREEAGYGEDEEEERDAAPLQRHRRSHGCGDVVGAGSSGGLRCEEEAGGDVQERDCGDGDALRRGAEMRRRS